MANPWLKKNPGPHAIAWPSVANGRTLAVCGRH